MIEDQIIDQCLHGKDLDVANEGSLEGVDGRQETVGVARSRARAAMGRMPVVWRARWLSGRLDQLCQVCVAR